MKFYLNVRDFFSLKHGANKYIKVKAVAPFLGKNSQHSVSQYLTPLQGCHGHGKHSGK